jgi:polyhydroxyalkanoate synthesis regulator phasin
MYPPCDIDKVSERGETWAVDPELREAFDRLGADLRGEIRSSAAETRAYVDERVQSSAAETRAYVDERVQSSAAETRAYVDDRLQTTTAETRRHFEVVGESLRSDIRGVAEGVALLSQRVDRGFAEQAGRTDGLEGRVVRLEVRVLSLEDNRKPPRSRRRR